MLRPAPSQVTATLPFQVVSSVTFTFVLYGMAGLRNSVVAVFQMGTLTTLMSLISVQVRSPLG
jgi:ABC-type multidrug transport system permease subunit